MAQVSGNHHLQSGRPLNRLGRVGHQGIEFLKSLLLVRAEIVPDSFDGNEPLASAFPVPGLRNTSHRSLAGSRSPFCLTSVTPGPETPRKQGFLAVPFLEQYKHPCLINDLKFRESVRVLQEIG
jgi:hypothetical protein